MESVIIDATPKGSAILAYGRAPQSRFRFVWIAAIVAGISLSVTLIALFAILRSIPLPERRLITIAAAPASIERILSTDQISDLPPSWRAAVRTGKTSPALFGISLDRDGQPITFAFVFGSVSAPDIGQTVRRAFRTLLVDAPSIDAGRARLSDVLPLFLDLRHADVSWTIGADELRAFVGAQIFGGASSGDIRGRWIGGRGELDLSAANAGSGAANASPFFVSLGGDARGSDVVKSAIIAQGIDIRGVGAAIRSVAFANEPFDVRASFPAPITSDDAHAIGAAFGWTESRPSSLGDSSMMEEIVIPTSTALDGQTEFSLSSATSPFAGSGAMGTAACAGVSILHLDGPVLENTLRAVGIPQSLRGRISSFDMVQADDGKTLVCIE